MSHIVIAGFQHETNTFAPLKATWDHFVHGEGWPGLTQGAAVFEVFAPMNIPIGGFIQEARALGHQLSAIAWAAAVPSAQVTEAAFEQMAALILDGLKTLAPCDAVYLDLHGAMVTTHLEDGEGELLRRVRAQVGPDIPVIASLDLHANTTALMLEQADLLVAYRTYPHLDMADTGRRAARLLDDILQHGRPAKARRGLPFLIPLTGQCTMVEPGQSVYAYLAELEQRPGIRSLSFTPGFPPADIWDCGPAVVAYADSQEAADAAADALALFIQAREADFAVPMLDPDTAVQTALKAKADKPYVLADVQDNSGAGATSDTTGLLAALVRHNAQNAVLGLLVDPAAAAAAHQAGLGADIELCLGGKLYQGDPPFCGRFTVKGLSNGRFLCTGPFYRGVQANLGLCAWLAIGGVSVVVSTQRMQAADQAQFRHLGIEPTAATILGLKSTVHFRGDFTALAADILIVEAAGAFCDRPDKLPYTRLRPGVRTRPKGQPWLGPLLA